MKTLPLGVEPIVSPRYTFDENKSLIGLSHSEVAEKLKEIGVPEKQCKMLAQQIWHWIYFRGAKTFDEMSNISKDSIIESKQQLIDYIADGEKPKSDWTI